MVCSAAVSSETSMCSIFGIFTLSEQMVVKADIATCNMSVLYSECGLCRHNVCGHVLGPCGYGLQLDDYLYS